MSPGSADIASEADRLCGIIAHHAQPLRRASLGPKFQLDDLSFHLYAKARNTVYRVSGGFDWFLKLPCDGGARAMEHEQLGADVITDALGNCPEYGGSSVIRVSTDPAYVLASTIRGQTLNKVVFTECWIPGRGAADRLEKTFQTLGHLLARMHSHGRVGADTPPATTRPFEMLSVLLARAGEPNAITNAIAAWNRERQATDSGTRFVHGNFRLDNVLRIDGRLGFLDFENCGTGWPNQDVSRPISDLLLRRCVPGFPKRRTTRCIKAFVGAYAGGHPHDPAQLWEFLRARLGRYYLETRTKRLFQRRIGGLPVSRSALDRLTLNAFRFGFAQVAPEIGG